MRAALFALAMMSASPALAGDAATLEILGFSADGGIFAFEEHGVQDGSGFPYANRFYINTADDSFMPGTPVRVRIDDEQASEADARAQAAQQGEAVVPAAVLAQNPGFTAGRNALTELSADPGRMRFYPRPVFTPIDAPIEIRAANIPLAPSETCAAMGDAAGLSLVQVSENPAIPARILHLDKDRIPSSRGCAHGYSLAAIQTFYPESGQAVFAVVVAVESYGFEGPDHRYMAVTARLEP